MTNTLKFALRATLDPQILTTPLGVLVFNPDGDILLTGDDSGIVNIWKVDTGRHFQAVRMEAYGAITCAVWLSNRAFAVGCQNGTINIYQQERQNSLFEFRNCKPACKYGFEVTCLAHEPKNNMMASTGAGVMQLWKINEELALIAVLKPTNEVPYTVTSVLFCNKGATVLVFELETRLVTAYSTSTRVLLWQEQLPTRIAFAVFSGDQRTILVSNLSSGVDSYKISTRSSGAQFHGSKSFVTPASLFAPLRVSTAKQGIYVVSGSEIGKVRIFDSRTGALVGQLKHQPSGGLVQEVACHSTDTKWLIASAATSPTDHSVKIWEYRSSPPLLTRLSWSLVPWVLCILIGFAAIAVVTTSLLLVKKEVVELFKSWLVLKLQQMYADNASAGRHYGLPT